MTMHTMIRGLMAGAAILAATVAQAATTLTLSTPDPDTAEITVAANKFAELVAAKTNGEVTIKDGRIVSDARARSGRATK